MRVRSRSRPGRSRLPDGTSRHQVPLGSRDLLARRGRAAWVALLVLASLAAAAAASFYVLRRGPAGDPPADSARAADVAGQVHTFCGHCHAYPPPDSFPRSAWRDPRSWYARPTARCTGRRRPAKPA